MLVIERRDVPLEGALPSSLPSGPLPGSALLPSLALAKKEKVDSREAEFHVRSVGWTLTGNYSILERNKIGQFEQANPPDSE
ncbi:hypothetical protein ACWPKO_32750 (plasmid) [Coraliomargarita sp. W4R53]